jgi:hypothetical protein
MQLWTSLFHFSGSVGIYNEPVNVSLQADKRISASHDGVSAYPAHIVEVFDSFFKAYQRLFDAVGEPTKRRGCNIAALGEALSCAAIQKHVDTVAIDVYT